MKYIYLFLVSMLFSTSAFTKIDEIFEGQTKIEKPFELRDPFQAPKFKSQSNRLTKQRAKGILDNIPNLDAEFDLESILIVGILIGKERRVLVKLKQGKTVSKEVYTLKEGDTFGRNGPEIKAILPGGVILVEKITNVYGEFEFIETVVPISK
ncbi:MAG: type IV pilus assembly protein PilP [Bacteriovoracaceae bacterium]|jgi:Tfp pilus assembly protein PilP